MTYDIDLSVGINTGILNDLCNTYVAEMGTAPANIFIEFNLFTDYIKKMMKLTSMYSPINSSKGLTGVVIYFSAGPIPVIPILGPHVPIFVGSKEEYDDNNLDAVFEQVVLKDCEHV